MFVYKTISPPCTIFGRPFVKQFALCYWIVVLSVTLVYCGEMVAWIKMPLGTEVGLGPSHTVRWGPTALKGVQTPIFGPRLLWPNSWMEQDVTSYGSRPQP